MEEFSDGGSTPPASTKKERHDVSRVFQVVEKARSGKQTRAGF